jgi:hypothetical protein
MNKYQEALEFLIKASDCDYKECKECSINKLCHKYEAVQTLQELVDKETPKKPLIKKYENSEHYLCPNCKGHRFGILDYGE